VCTTSDKVGVTAAVGITPARRSPTVVDWQRSDQRRFSEAATGLDGVRSDQGGVILLQEALYREWS
jgi:hypothetical protein